MSDLLRQEITASAQRLVVKVGTRVVTDAEGKLDAEVIHRLAEDLCRLAEAGREVVLVSSGAVGAGLKILELDRRPSDLARLQAVAAVGQTKLMDEYERWFFKHGRHAAQVLLTADDLNDRKRYLNVRNTLLSLLEMGAIPVINENDTVAVDELMLTVGDNDRLAAMVTNLLRAPLLVILSDIDGLYDGDPSSSTSSIVHEVMELDEDIFAYVRDRQGETSQQSQVTKGGMLSKLEAARMVTTAGENMIIANGNEPGVISRIMAAEQVGTLFVAKGKAVSSRKRWIGFSVQLRGELTMDEGACRAIVQQGRSLLAIGIATSSGDFEIGDVVSILDSQGNELARGLSNYSSDEVKRIQGRRSDQIAEILGHCPYQEVIHRDNLLVTGQ